MAELQSKIILFCMISYQTKTVAVFIFKKFHYQILFKKNLRNAGGGRWEEDGRTALRRGRGGIIPLHLSLFKAFFPLGRCNFQSQTAMSKVTNKSKTTWTTSGFWSKNPSYGSTKDKRWTQKRSQLQTRNFHFPAFLYIFIINTLLY